jgi:hypothetical protein
MKSMEEKLCESSVQAKDTIKSNTYARKTTPIQ